MILIRIKIIIFGWGRLEKIELFIIKEDLKEQGRLSVRRLIKGAVLRGVSH